MEVGDIKYASVTIRIMKELTDKDGEGLTFKLVPLAS
jgi:hypothetical protein